MGAASGRKLQTGLGASERRVLNPRPYRVFRKRYSTAEAKAGAVVLVLLAAIAAWTARRGARPDPALFADPALLAKGGPAAKAEPGPKSEAPPAAAPSPAKAADRGSLPLPIAAPGWSEGPVTRFDAENLYVKIDGRADFFLARGFRSMTFVTLSGPAGAAVDVELYDLGAPESALGAFAAERPPGTKATNAGGTSWYVARNALFLARGGSYARAIGSDESPAVLAQLEALRKAFEGTIAAGERPWNVALFGDALGLPPDRVEYAAENAFSFGFARNVSSATLDDGETEAFVLPAGDEAKARALAAKFEEGFLSYGDKAEGPGGAWVKDRYVGTFARAVAAGTMVVGVRGAPDPARANEALEKLARAVRALPPGVARKAAAGPPAGRAAKGGDHG